MDQKTAFQIASSYQFDTPKIELGPWTSYSLLEDPKHMSFVLARYKFVAKMLRQGGRTLEIGCGDGFGAPIAKQHSSEYVGVDVDSRLVDDNNQRLASRIPGMSFKLQDITESGATSLGKFDTVFSVDVLEHLDAEKEEPFLKSSVNLLNKNGIYICGTPSAYSANYATERSRIQHINLKTAPQKKELLEQYFHYVWIFSMNDEVVHTGFYPMAHYLFALCAGKKG
jgi:2-polyprenyl-3-methyl-5-hydroxy-6-metoxy-1,4-benzoquinol methylase